MNAPATPTPHSLLTQTFSYWPAWPTPYSVPLHHTQGQKCAYLEGKNAVTPFLVVHHLPAEAYQQFMDAGFRRSGAVLYQPACPHCRECVPLRVPVETFRPSKAQQRCWRKNRDLHITVGHPHPDRNKHDLYVRYLEHRHNATQNRDWDGFVEFLYTTPVPTLEFCYYNPKGRLVGVGVCDVTPLALSSVYFYFDPAENRRGLGTFSSLVEIEWCRQQGRSYYFLGFWVPSCPKMAYKCRFEPHELLGTDRVWRKKA